MYLLILCVQTNFFITETPGKKLLAFINFLSEKELLLERGDGLPRKEEVGELALPFVFVFAGIKMPDLVRFLFERLPECCSDVTDFASWVLSVRAASWSALQSHHLSSQLTGPKNFLPAIEGRLPAVRHSYLYPCYLTKMYCARSYSF